MAAEIKGHLSDLFPERMKELEKKQGISPEESITPEIEAAKPTVMVSSQLTHGMGPKGSGGGRGKFVTERRGPYQHNEQDLETLEAS